MIGDVFGRKADYYIYSADIWIPVVFGGLREEYM